MEHKKSSNEFEALIDDEGKITIPSELRKHLAGKTLHVRLHKEEVSAGLKEKGVTEDEVERIASVQLESREQVVKFFLSEGALANDQAFAQRAKRETKH